MLIAFALTIAACGGTSAPTTVPTTVPGASAPVETLVAPTTAPARSGFDVTLDGLYRQSKRRGIDKENLHSFDLSFSLEARFTTDAVGSVRLTDSLLTWTNGCFDNTGEGDSRTRVAVLTGFGTPQWQTPELRVVEKPGGAVVALFLPENVTLSGVETMCEQGVADEPLGGVFTLLATELDNEGAFGSVVDGEQLGWIVWEMEDGASADTRAEQTYTAESFIFEPWTLVIDATIGPGSGQ